MVLRCLRAELMKCRRAPVWLAFLVLPSSRGTGHLQLPGQPGGAGRRLVQPWTQHTLFASMFFLPAQFGVFCAWQWRLEHADHNWNAALTALVPVRALYLGKLLLDVGVSALAMALIGLLFLLSGRLAGISAPCPRSCPAGWPSAPWAVRRCAPYSSTSVCHPRLRPAGSHRPGGWNLRPAPYQPGASAPPFPTPALPGYAGQQPPDALPLPPPFLAGCGSTFCSLSAGRTAAPPAGMPSPVTPRAIARGVCFTAYRKGPLRRQEGL